MTKKKGHLPSLNYIFLLPLLLSFMLSYAYVATLRVAFPFPFKSDWLDLVTHQISEVNEQHRTKKEKCRYVRVSVSSLVGSSVSLVFFQLCICKPVH
jgi:hypothetical protein